MDYNMDDNSELEIDLLKQQNDTLKQCALTQTTKLGGVEAQNSKLVDKMRKMKEDNKKLEDKVTMMSNEMSDLNNKAEEIEMRISRMEKEKKKSNSKLNNMKEENNELKEKVVELESENKKLMAQLNLVDAHEKTSTVKLCPSSSSNYDNVDIFQTRNFENRDSLKDGDFHNLVLQNQQEAIKYPQTNAVYNDAITEEDEQDAWQDEESREPSVSTARLNLHYSTYQDQPQEMERQTAFRPPKRQAAFVKAKRTVSNSSNDESEEAMREIERKMFTSFSLQNRQNPFDAMKKQFQDDI